MRNQDGTKNKLNNEEVKSMKAQNDNKNNLINKILKMEDYYNQHPDKITPKVNKQMLTDESRLMLLITQQKLSSNPFNPKHHVQSQWKKIEDSTHVTPKHIHTSSNMTKQEHAGLLKRRNHRGPDRQ